MNVFRRWWKKPATILEWVPGLKHPETLAVVFKNVWGCDLKRRVLKSRCHECGFVVSDDDKAAKELVYTCRNPKCDCSRIGNSRSHHVCEACYDIFHSLYLNYTLKNRNYFREIDQAEAEGRKRMGMNET